MRDILLNLTNPFNAIDDMSFSNPLNLSGAILLNDKTCRFTIWAPLRNTMRIHVVDPELKADMQKDEDGYFTVTLQNIKPGTRYFFMPDGEGDIPDPASHYQPETVHGPSQVVDHTNFQWTDDLWKGLPFKELVIYEIHVGTFTKDGTFQAIIPRLDDLRDVGVNALELMPVTQFPGNRNWGYDGVFPYAVQNSYGGPDGLRKLVDACHQKGIAVFLDAVYNHVGPEGNYFSRFGPYFNNKYSTPWGGAINYDGEWSDGVRDYFSRNALYWFAYYHIDGLRLDAVHMLFDNGAVHFWHYLNEKVSALSLRLGRPLYLIAESDFNSPRVVNSPAVGGYGFTAQWLDDFHHALYVLVHKKGRERYIDFGTMQQLSKAYTDGFVHSGEYVSFRKRRHGTSSAGIAGDKFVVFNLNHDQVGNRPLGERLCVLVDNERLKLATAALMFAPYVPMLFMGEEYADRSPFFYFVSHSDPALVEAVRKGRKEEFKDFGTGGESPDPQDEKTFTASKLQWDKRKEGSHMTMLLWHKTLIGFRKQTPAMRNFTKNDVRTHVIDQNALIVYRQEVGGKNPVICLMNFSEAMIECAFPYDGSWVKLLDSRAPEWNENGKVVDLMPATITAQAKISIMPLSATVYGQT
jgi:maltooligosyltrehalose trehalohydrolase